MINFAKHESWRHHVWFLLIEFTYLVDSLVALLSLGFLSSNLKVDVLFNTRLEKWADG